MFHPELSIPMVQLGKRLPAYEKGVDYAALAEDAEIPTDRNTRLGIGMLFQRRSQQILHARAEKEGGVKYKILRQWPTSSTRKFPFHGRPIHRFEKVFMSKAKVGCRQKATIGRLGNHSSLGYRRYGELEVLGPGYCRYDRFCVPPPYISSRPQVVPIAQEWLRKMS